MPSVQHWKTRLATLSDDAEIGRFLNEQRAALIEAWSPETGGRAWMLQHTELIDAVVRRLFALSVERATAADDEDSEKKLPDTVDAHPVAIVATGGYGRRELSPHSDLDITFLPARDDDDFVGRVIKEMFRLVMDVFLSGARMKVGYAYRLLSDQERLDHQTQTALLDARCVAGSHGLFALFDRSFGERLQRTDFCFRKYAERNAVLDRAGTITPYTVEPNLKEGAGGLRDLQSAEWVAEVRFDKSGEALWRDLVRRKVLTADEAKAISEAREYLFRVRNLLHLLTGEAKDTLTAERQEAIATRLGYPDVDENGAPGVELFMREYYSRVACVHHVANKILVRCLNSPLPLTDDGGLSSVRRAVAVTDPVAAGRDPLWPLRALDACQTYDLELALATEEAIQAFVEESDTTPGTDAGRLFLQLLSRPRNVHWTVRQMRDTSLLKWLLPELDVCMDLIPYDPAHEFTVGEHTLRVLRNLEALRGANTDPSLAEYRRVIEEIASPETLYLAALLHDIGKQWPGKHAETGADAAVAICARLGCSQEMTDRVVFLIRNHLVMAETSRLRDLALAETIEGFVRVVPDLELLRMLYLLTYADTAAVGAGVWTEVKARFLGDLYARAEAVLAEPRFASVSDSEPNEDAPRPAANLAAFRERVRRQLSREKRLPVEAIHEHTSAMPAAYLLNTSIEDMVLHMAMIGRVRETFQPFIDTRTPFGAGYTELTIVAYDDPRPGLLAKIAAVLFAYDINVHAAQVFTRTSSDRIAIDTLWVDFRGNPLSPAKRGELESAFRQVLTGDTTTAALLAKRGKPTDIVQPVVSLRLDDTSADHFSILDIQATDDRGVLYRLAAALSQVGWNIHSARLSAFGGYARNAFYVTNVAGDKLGTEALDALNDLLPHEQTRRRRPQNRPGSRPNRPPSNGR